MRATAFALAACLLFASCAQRTGRVEREMLLPMGAARHAVDEQRQRFLMAVPIHDPMPAFPEGLPQRLRRPVAVCAGFVVTGEGDTVAIAAQAPTPACTGSTGVEPALHAHLRASVVAALEQWRWFGAAICTFPDGIEADGDCRAEGVEVRPVTIRLDYRFVFEPDGRRVSARR